MSVAMFFLVISQVVLIPIVFQVHKTNNRVMSLFGIIPIAEIKELATKCEKYMQRFLEDRSEKKDEGTVEPMNKEGETPEGENVDGEAKDPEDAKSANNVFLISM
jgi:hypothetical protein